MYVSSNKGVVKVINISTGICLKTVIKSSKEMEKLQKKQ